MNKPIKIKLRSGLLFRTNAYSRVKEIVCLNVDYTSTRCYTIFARNPTQLIAGLSKSVEMVAACERGPVSSDWSTYRNNLGAWVPGRGEHDDGLID